MPIERTGSDFGAKLREARERRGIPLRQIANATKISVAVLEALERNDIARLPGGIFGRAFVRSYAVEVGLDPERTIQEFVAQFPHDSIVAGHPVAHQIEVHAAASNEAPRWSTALLVIAIGVASVGSAVYFGAGRTLVSYAERLMTAAATPPQPPSDPPAAVSIPAPPAAPDRTAPETSTPGESAARSTETNLSAPAPVAPAGGADYRFIVRLSVLRPCWISAMVDGRKAIERLLQTGEDQTIDVRREMVLTTGDAGAVALTLNGESAKPLGSAGEVVTARLNLANFRDFLLR
jgi:cytoskeleton protein RodZ